MNEGENRQLLIAAAASLFVLGGGAFFWFGHSEAPVVPGNIPDVSLKPVAPAPPTEADGSQSKRKKVAPPPTLITGLKRPSVRPWDQAGEVYSALSNHHAAYQACYELALKERPKAKGRAILQFDLEEGALSSEVGVELRAIPSLELRDCFAKATPAIDFSGVKGKTRVLWPLVMWPDKGLAVQEPIDPLDGD